MDLNTTAKARLHELLTECVGLDASDLHLAPGLPPYYRLNGEVVPHDSLAPLSPDDIEAIAELLMAASGRTRFDRDGAEDGAFGCDGVRFRFNVYRRLGGLSIALRRLEDEFRSLRELGMPESLYDLCALPDGLVLVAGPTGAGKSTTLATLIQRINETRRVHIITIEDPIEYLHEANRSLINQRQVGSDAATFDGALVASLREDPDVILVGEVRDLATMRTAIRAAETGHLVMSTVHASDAVGAIERLVSLFPADEQAGVRVQLALSLRAIVAQHLIPTRIQLDPARHEGLEARRRRVPVCEILLSNSAVSHLVAAGKSAQVYSAMESGTGLGMQTLEQDLARLLAAGSIQETQAVAIARNPRILLDRAAQLGWKRDPRAPRGGYS